jgi:hypothetical protein
MFRKVNFFSTFRSAVIAAMLFIVPVYFFIREGLYRESWLLYLGSFLFLVVIWIHTLRENKLRGENESTVAMVFISHVATIAGIILASIFSFILLSIMVPGYLESGPPDRTLVGEPANVIKDKTDGLSFQVFFAATVINFSVGSFTGIILSFYSKRNQIKDPKEPSPMHNYGRK